MEISIFTLVCVVLMLIAWPTHVVVEAYYYQGKLGRVLERDLGFEHGSKYLFEGESHKIVCSAVCIQHVIEGGIFSNAGFRSGDVLPDVSHTSLFKLLHRHRGREVELKIVDGGRDGPIFHLRPRKTIRFVVPVKAKDKA